MHREKREETKNFHNLMVPLFADFAPKRLLEFLKSSDNYDIPKARDVVEAKGLVSKIIHYFFGILIVFIDSKIDERIYLLARSGNTKQALNLILLELHDIFKAVDFCKEQDDMELWTQLIDFR